MNKLLQILLTLLLITNLSFAATQDSHLKFDKITGLSQNSITSIIQDSQGFIWFGTYDGLNKFDGYQFTFYTYSPSGKNILSDFNITTLLEDREKNLWIGTKGGGLNRYHIPTNTFHSYPKAFPIIGDKEILATYQTFQGQILIGATQGIYKYDRKGDNFSPLLSQNQLKDTQINSIYEDSNGVIWIGTDEGLYKFNPMNQEIQFYNLNDDRITKILEDSIGRLWVGTESGIVLFDRENTAFRSYNIADLSSSEVNVKTIYQDSFGEIWVGTYSGLLRFSPQDDQFITYRHQMDNPHSISHDFILSIYEDSAKNLWVGTESGLNKLNRRTEQFINYQHDPNNENTLSSSDVWAIYQDKAGDYWVGTEDGLNRLDTNKKLSAIYKYDPDDKFSISSNRVRTIYEDNQGQLWIGTMNGGLNRYDKNSGKFYRYLHDPANKESLNDNSVWTILQDSFDNLWIGTGKGLDLLLANDIQSTQSKFIHFIHDESPINISGNHIVELFEDSSKNLWIGTFGDGLNKIDLKKYIDSDFTNVEFQSFIHKKEDSSSISYNRIWTITEDAVKNLWVGTVGGGLNKFDPATKTFTYFTQKDGLPNNVVHGVVLDSDGMLWISTNKGLSKFNPTENTFLNFDDNDGLPGDEFNPGAHNKSILGEILFGGDNGLTIFDPQQIKTNNHPPQIAITSFKIFDKEANFDYLINELGQIDLSHRQNFITIKFAALDFTNPQKNRYAYKLEGFDKKWRTTDANNRIATYTNLPGKNYTFIIKGSNNDGLWNDEGTSIKLAVSPPPWKTWWAYTLYVLAILGGFAIYAIYQHFKFKRERAINARLRHVDRLKDEFLANTSHELRTPLNGIIGIAESLLDGVAGNITEKMGQNLTMIYTSGSRLANLVNDILDFSKLKNHTIQLQKKPVDMKTLTDLVIKLNAPLIANKNIIIQNEIPANVPAVDGDENRLQQIMHNLIGNAIKFTDSGEITISAKEKPDNTKKMLKISITDTGIGIPEEKQKDIFQSFRQADASISRKYGGTGLGLAITRQLVELHGGMVWLVSEVGKGSRFSFSIPISQGEAQPMEMAIETKPSKIHKNIGDETNFVMTEKTKSSGKFHILVVDDEPINIQVLTNHLSSANYRITQALNGEQALKLLEDNIFDLILLDIMMPKISGYEVCQKIRENCTPNQLPVLMVTAKNQVSDLVEAFSLGANDYLTKPFSKNELLARIKTHIQLSKINIAYSRFVPTPFLSHLQKESIIDVHLGDQVQKEMTVLFSDIRDFTTLSEQMTPKDNFAFINSYLSRMEPIIEQHHGFVDKYIGDAIMALFDGSADDALQGAIKMLQELNDWNPYRFKNTLPQIKIGIGLNTGPLMLGTIGGPKRMDSTVISDNVNLASRLEGLTKLFGASLLISHQTLFALENAPNYNYRFIAKIKVKGKKEPVSVFELLDGYPPEEIKLKSDTREDFEKAIFFYHDRKIDEAFFIFHDVLKENPDDVAAKFYFDRCKQLVKNGIPTNWESVEIMRTK